MSTTEYATYRAGKAKEIERLELQAKSFSDTFKKQIQHFTHDDLLYA